MLSNGDKNAMGNDRFFGSEALLRAMAFLAVFGAERLSLSCEPVSALDRGPIRHFAAAFYESAIPLRL